MNVKTILNWLVRKKRVRHLRHQHINEAPPNLLTRKPEPDFQKATKETKGEGFPEESEVRNKVPARKFQPVAPSRSSFPSAHEYRRSGLRLPPLGSLPGGVASLHDLIRFTREFDPTTHFHQHWAANYKTEVNALWERCVKDYLAGTPASGGPDELLMCMTYDCVLGPSLGVPDRHKAKFLHWLVEGIRKSLSQNG